MWYFLLKEILGQGEDNSSCLPLRHSSCSLQHVCTFASYTRGLYVPCGSSTTALCEVSAGASSLLHLPLGSCPDGPEVRKVLHILQFFHLQVIQVVGISNSREREQAIEQGRVTQLRGLQSVADGKRSEPSKGCLRCATRGDSRALSLWSGVCSCGLFEQSVKAAFSKQLSSLNAQSDGTKLYGN